MFSSYCDQLIVLVETFFIGLTNIYFGILLDSVGWNILSLFLLTIGSLFILGGIILVIILSKNKQPISKLSKPKYEYMHIDSLV